MSTSDAFPVWALLPKKETNVDIFLNKYPEYDGRGVKIAIIDTGVDPGAAGLQITSDGKPKIVDMYDATGAGNVDTSTVVKADDDGFITGLTGTKLKIPNEWTNPSGEYHIGMKNIYELYPKEVRKRMIEKYMENEWKPKHRIVSSDALKMLRNFEAKHTEASNDSPEDKLIREDLQSQVDCLKQIDDIFEDLGPTYDCIIFNDGQHWRGLIDKTGTGDLSKCVLLGNYSNCLKYDTISDMDMLNYCINIYDDGNLMQIVANNSSHGTHVACIAAANFPEKSIKNGVAPGAQIVSIYIGGNLNQNTFKRALIKVIECKCDVINLSYGTYDYINSSINKFMKELITKYGIIFVTSAGNSGPIHSSTLSSKSLAISVGAYVSPDMIRAQNSLFNDKASEMAYSFTSRGPSVNGDLGVSVCAPGGAITSVSNCELKGSDQMFGTSMSSPHTAGAVCLLLSGLKMMDIPYSPFSIRKSFESTANQYYDNYDVFTAGHGLIQIDKAFEHLIQFKDSIDSNIRFKINTGNKKVGIYLREQYEVTEPSKHTVFVETKYLNHKEMESKHKLQFEMILQLSCSQQWLTYPPFIYLTYGNKNFDIEVDPQTLSDGEIHFTMLKAFDATCPEKGPIFEIPITVIKPLKICKEKSMKFTEIIRSGYFWSQYIHIPNEVTSMVVSLKNKDSYRSGNFVLQTMQLATNSEKSNIEYNKNILLLSGEESQHSIIVDSGRTIELCFGKYWKCLSDIEIKIKIQFNGIQLLNKQSLILSSTDFISTLDIKSNFTFETITPRISLYYYELHIKPTNSEINAMSERETIPKGRCFYELILTYKFNLPKDHEIYINSNISRYYDFELQMIMLFEEKTKRYIDYGYYRQSKMKLKKGDYLIKIQVCHELVNNLNKLKDTVITVCYKLSPTLSLDIYDNREKAITGGTKIVNNYLVPNKVKQLFIKSLSSSSVPLGLPELVAGSCFTGYIYLFDNFTHLLQEDNILYINNTDFKKLSPDNSITNQNKSKENNKKLPKDEFNEELIKLKCNWISKLNKEMSDQLFEELIADNKINAILLLSRIKALESDDCRSQHLVDIITMSDTIINDINIDDLISQMAIKKSEQIENEEAIKNIETKRSQLLEALVKKGLAISDIIDPSNKQNVDINGSKQLTDNKEIDENKTQESKTIDNKENINENVIKENKENSTKESKLVDSYEMTININENNIKNILINDIKEIENKEINKSETKMSKTIDKNETINNNELQKSCNTNESNDNESKEIKPHEDTTNASYSINDLNVIFQMICKLIDPYDLKVSDFTERHAIMNGQYGRALKLFMKKLELLPTNDNIDKCFKILNDLNWTHIINGFIRIKHVMFPKEFKKF